MYLTSLGTGPLAALSPEYGTTSERSLVLGENTPESTVDYFTDSVMGE